jgi:hypothetical protein
MDLLYKAGGSSSRPRPYVNVLLYITPMPLRTESMTAAAMTEPT